MAANFYYIKQNSINTKQRVANFYCIKHNSVNTNLVNAAASNKIYVVNFFK